MIGLSSEIEAGIDSVIEGLSYDISLDHLVRDFSEFEDYHGFNASITIKGSNRKITGEIVDSTDKEVIIRFYTKNTKTKEREPTDRKVAFSSIKDARVYEKEADMLEADKMKSIIDSKTSTFSMAKGMLNQWVNSPNAPSKEKLVSQVERLVKAGDKSLKFLREALAYSIDYDSLETHKINSAVKVKPIILKGIFELDSSIKELRNQLESDQLNLVEKEFKIGYPERFAKGEFYPEKDYWKEWYNEKEDAVMICPFGTKGKVLELQGLNVQLPVPPKDKTKILFHDLPKEEQYWRRLDVPENITPDNEESFDDFIREEFRRRREGIWFYNNGEPVYLTGNAYFALQWCLMWDNGLYMDFRYAQLHMFYHLEACIRDPRCLGQIFLKSRRTGFTYIVLAILMNMSTSMANSKFGMTSKSGDDVQEAFDKFSYMFLNLPHYLRPVVKGKEDSPAELFFGKPSNNSKEAKKSRNTNIKDYLNTVVDHRPTKNDSYDSVKLDGYLGDEAGKWKKPHDYITHWGMVGPTMMPAGEVVGKAFIGSTMGSKEEGGKQFAEMIKGSFVEDRDPITEKTSTALYFYFLAAQDNMPAFTDKYGKCWTETPPEGTLNILGKPITRGSVDYLKAIEKQKERQSEKAYNEQIRTYPRSVKYAMRDESNSCVFNSTKLDDQMDYNEEIPEESRYVVGNFNWKNGVEDGDVVFNPDKKGGRFKVAWMPSAADGTEHLQNRVEDRNGKFYPLNRNIVRFGCDPFSLKSTHGKGSKGAAHGKTMYLPEAEVPRNKFVVEYIARPQSDTMFFEDIIKVIRFYGAPILVESNRIDLLRHMRNRGYRGFAMDRLDRHPSKLNANEKEYGGQVMSGKDIIDSHMNSIGSWVEENVGRATEQDERPTGEMGDMPFDETLEDWKNFDPDNRTEYDATISSGLAIMACQTEKYKGKKPDKDPERVKSLFKKYSNSGSIGRPVVTQN